MPEENANWPTHDWYELPATVKGVVLLDLGRSIDTALWQVSEHPRIEGENCTTAVKEALTHEKNVLKARQRAWSILSMTAENKCTLLDVLDADTIAWFANRAHTNDLPRAATLYCVAHMIGVNLRKRGDTDVVVPSTPEDLRDVVLMLETLNAWDHLPRMLEKGWSQETLDALQTLRLEALL